jgi:hypothetical protein
MSKFAITESGLMKSFGHMPVICRPLFGFGAMAIGTNEEAIRLTSSPIPHGIQASSFRYGNKFKTICEANKYFLTIFCEQLGFDERCEPRK